MIDGRLNIHYADDGAMIVTDIGQNTTDRRRDIIDFTREDLVELLKRYDEQYPMWKAPVLMGPVMDVKNALEVVVNQTLTCALRHYADALERYRFGKRHLSRRASVHYLFGGMCQVADRNYIDWFDCDRDAETITVERDRLDQMSLQTVNTFLESMRAMANKMNREDLLEL